MDGLVVERKRTADHLLRRTVHDRRSNLVGSLPLFDRKKYRARYNAMRRTIGHALSILDDLSQRCNARKTAGSALIHQFTIRHHVPYNLCDGRQGLLRVREALEERKVALELDLLGIHVTHIV